MLVPAQKSGRRNFVCALVRPSSACLNNYNQHKCLHHNLGSDCVIWTDAAFTAACSCRVAVMAAALVRGREVMLQDCAASKAFSMLTEWKDFADSLARDRAMAPAATTRSVAASSLAAISLHDHAGSPAALVDRLQGGWLPVLSSASVRTVADVPWLQDLGEIMTAMGFVVERTPHSTAQSVRMVCFHPRHQHRSVCTTSHVHRQSSCLHRS